MDAFLGVVTQGELQKGAGLTTVTRSNHEIEQARGIDLPSVLEVSAAERFVSVGRLFAEHAI